MQKTYVYKITRIDGLEYIGITLRLKKRFKDHYNSNRFSIGVNRFSVLKVCDTYEEAEKLEELYIQQFDTYYNGLNETIDGKGNHLSPKFTTKGMTFSEESRRKMSENHWSKKGYKNGMTGRKHNENTKKEWSKLRKGFFWGKRKISKNEWMKIYSDYINENNTFSNEYISNFVKKSDKDKALNGDFRKLEELIAPNGKPLNYKTIFSKYYSEKYDITPQAIIGIINCKGITSDDYKAE